AQEAATIQRSSDRISQSFVLLWAAVSLSAIGAGVTTGVANAVFRRMEWQRSELAALSRHVIESQESTARRFSRELHDEFGQILSALEANLIAVRLGQNQAERLDDCMKLVKDAISNVRHLSQLLRPSILDDFGLNAGLAWLAEGFEQRTGIKVDYDSSFNGRLADEAETHLFRIAQEALTNVARHANASRVQIELIGSEMQVLLRISDNGNGLTASKQRSGMGLIGMRARARTFGGEFNINTKPGKGCEIQVMVPLEGTNLAKENSNPVG
ncbi:MAG TPA: sensor histidine kinase, partial [Bryobacteraceae bacterium]|nr:sensor histidine kinase [Bryobacteraceae bacterium]